MTPKTLADTLAIQFRYTQWVVNANLKDVDGDQYFRAPDPAGNCLNWVLGHMVSARNGCLAMLGQDPVIAPETIDRYQRGSAPVAGPDGAVPPTELLDAFNRAQNPLLAGLSALTDEALAAPAPFSPNDDDDETAGSLLAGLLFHEAYHAGQLGVIRRTLGIDGAIS